MENDSKINERENENIQVYPPVKSSIDNSESKKFLHLFSKKTGNKIPSDKRDSNSNPKNTENTQEKEQKPINLEDELFLINKGIEQSQRKSKRTGDIKSALENFLRKSDLIEKSPAPDSSRPWARVMLAGTPLRCISLTAMGAYF